MEIKTSITKHDLVEFRLHNRVRGGQGRGLRIACALLPPLAAIGAVFWLVTHRVSGPIRLLTTLPVVLILPLYLVLFYRVTRRNLARKLDLSPETEEDRAGLGEHLVAMTEDGITSTHGADTRFYSWSQVLRVIADGDYCFIYTGRDQAIIIPRHSFADDHAFHAWSKIAVIFHFHIEQGAKSAEAQQSPESEMRNEGMPVPAVGRTRASLVSNTVMPEPTCCG